MEEALQTYYLAYEKCSVLCEGPYDHESLPDFYNAIAGIEMAKMCEIVVYIHW